MKKGLKIASIAHNALWIVLFIISLIERVSYKVPGDESISIAFAKGVYAVLILMTVLGFFTSVLLSLCLHAIFAPNITKINTLEKVTLLISVMTNLLFYLTACLLFLLNIDKVVIAAILWALCAFVCLVLLIVLWTKNRQKRAVNYDNNTGAISTP